MTFTVEFLGQFLIRFPLLKFSTINNHFKTKSQILSIGSHAIPKPELTSVLSLGASTLTKAEEKTTRKTLPTLPPPLQPHSHCDFLLSNLQELSRNELKQNVLINVAKLQRVFSFQSFYQKREYKLFIELRCHDN